MTIGYSQSPPPPSPPSSPLSTSPPLRTCTPATSKYPGDCDVTVGVDRRITVYPECRGFRASARRSGRTSIRSAEFSALTKCRDRPSPWGGGTVGRSPGEMLPVDANLCRWCVPATWLPMTPETCKRLYFAKRSACAWRGRFLRSDAIAHLSDVVMYRFARRPAADSAAAAFAAVAAAVAASAAAVAAVAAVAVAAAAAAAAAAAGAAAAADAVAATIAVAVAATANAAAAAAVAAAVAAAASPSPPPLPPNFCAGRPAGSLRSRGAASFPGLTSMAARRAVAIDQQLLRVTGRGCALGDHAGTGHTGRVDPSCAAVDVRLVRASLGTSSRGSMPTS